MGIMRHGVHKPLEDDATAFIVKSLKSASGDVRGGILTPGKLQLRQSREVYAASGTPDPANRSGMYHRNANKAAPWLNSRDGQAGSSSTNRRAPSSPVRSSLADYVADHILGERK